MSRCTVKPTASHKATIGQNVISMFGYKCETQFPAINELEAYWEGLRMGRLVPMRSEIDPRGIERALEYTFILERIAPGLAKFRLSGEHLNDLLGMEVRGMPFTSFFTPKARQEIIDTMEAVFDGPQTAELILKGERSIGKPALDAKLILLPLRSDLGEVTRIVGCLVSNDKIGRAPRRFDIVSKKMKVLTRASGQAPSTFSAKSTETPTNAFKYDATTPSTAPTKPVETTRFNFSEPSVPFVTADTDSRASQVKADEKTSKKTQPTTGPNLRLVKTDT